MTINFNEPAVRERLNEFIAHAAGARHAAVTAYRQLTDGAIQENWALDVEVDGSKAHWVLRTDAQAVVSESLPRAQEFAILKAVHPENVFAPRPLYLCTDLAVMGRVFFIMERLPGIASANKLTRDPALIADRVRLAGELAVNLARLHTIKPPHPQLGFLKTVHARDSTAHYRLYLDRLEEPHPALEWGLRWCELNAPAHEETTFIHRDYRTGNYLVHEHRLAGVLDWEFAAFGNPLEDVGWIFAKCWRFAGKHLPAGGIAETADFVEPYQRESGRTVSAEALVYWQVMAHIRWAVIALQQAQRHLSGIEPSLELALTGRIVAELEHEILVLTA